MPNLLDRLNGATTIIDAVNKLAQSHQVVLVYLHNLVSEQKVRLDYLLALAAGPEGEQQFVDCARAFHRELELLRTGLSEQTAALEAVATQNDAWRQAAEELMVARGVQLAALTNSVADLRRQIQAAESRVAELHEMNEQLRLQLVNQERRQERRLTEVCTQLERRLTDGDRKLSAFGTLFAKRWRIAVWVSSGLAVLAAGGWWR